MLKNKYKDKNPIETITFIKNFFENRGFVLEIEHIKSFENLYSCKVDLFYDNELIHRSYGKGTTKEFSEASGCAEMMERVISKNINGATYVMQQNINRNKPFYITKDEKIFTYDEIKDINYKMLAKYKKETTEQKYKEILFECYDFIEDNQRKYICVPFKNMFTEEVEYVPYQIYTTLTGSTGLAFGNTFEEASVQAISEIIERYVIKQIGTEKTNTPIIPNEHIRFLNIDLYNTIKEIEKDSQYKIVIKEASLNKGYPTISVILFDKKTFGYLIYTGTSPIFDIALERCLTEMYQTCTKESILALTSSQNLVRKRKENFKNEDMFNLLNSCTYYNDSFFLTNNKKYSLSHFSKENSNKELLKYYKNLLKNNGYEIFYRETKIENSSVVNICIPFMSEWGNNTLIKMTKSRNFYNKEILDDNKYKNNILSSNHDHIRIDTQTKLNNGAMDDYMNMVDKILKKDYSSRTGEECFKIKEKLDNIYYLFSCDSYSKSFKEMYCNLYSIVSTIDMFISFYNHKEEHSLLKENPFIDNKTQKLIKALIDFDTEKLKEILINENLFINKKLEEKIVKAYDVLNI